MKTRTVTRYRQVEHVIDGRAATVQEPYQVEIPVPPVDLDRIVHGGITVAAVLLLLVSISWSTASVGGLLAHAVVEGVAYSAAAGFDLVWIICMGAEWLARYEPGKAWLPRWAGHVALLVAMTAVATNGWLYASPAVGLVGALVSALAKLAWTIVLRHNAKPLDPLTQQWVQKQRAEVGARLAMVPVRRQLARAEGQVAAEYAALDTPNTTTDRPGHPSGLADATVRSAIRAALSTTPDASPADIVATLSALGIQVTEGDVRAISNVHPIRATGQVSIADTIRTELSAGNTDPDDILATVRAVHGQHVREDTVMRTLRRHAPTTARSTSP